MKRLLWHCLRCGLPMYCDLEPVVNAVINAVAPTALRNGVLHVCGGCKNMHRVDSNGLLRNLTAEERFRLYVEVPGTMAAIERTTFTTTVNGDEGTLIIGRE